MEGVEGKTFKPLAYTVSLAMLGSLIFALFLAPVASQIIMRRPKNSGISKEKNENLILRWLQKLYEPLIRFFIKKRTIAIALALVLLITGSLIYPQLGSEFTPTLQEGTIVMRLTLAPSISLNESIRTTQIVERRLKKIQEVEKVVNRIGRV